MSVMLYPCMFCVACLTLFVNCFICELFGETIRNMFGCVRFCCSMLWNVKCGWR